MMTSLLRICITYYVIYAGTRDYLSRNWKQSFLPSGRVGKDFVLELARLFQSYADNSTLHSIALTACSVFQVLMLQKPPCS